MILFSVILIYLAFANLHAYRAFAADKQFAIDKQQRTPEVVLLSYARRGGWIGAKVAQKKLQHKSRKQPFGSQLNTIGALHAACVMTFALVIGFLALTPSGPPVVRAVKMAEADVPAVQPADALLAISLRPPAVRPSGW